MDKNQTDGHLKKSTTPKCGHHPTQKPKYYCSDSKCRALLCLLCMKTHPKEHLPTMTTIENVKSQTLETFKNEALSRFGKYIEGIIKSNEVNGLFTEALGTLMQQNTTVDLDDEDMADILADTLQRKFFEVKFTMKKMVQENLSIESSSACLIAFDFEYDGYDDEEEEEHRETASGFCQYPPGYDCREDLEIFYAESKAQGIFWSPKEQTLVCQDVINPEKNWTKYKIPLAFNSLTVLDSEKLVVVIPSENSLLIYSIEEEGGNDMNSRIENEAAKDVDYEDHLPLKMFKEFPQEDEILFLASDHVNHLFVVTEGEDGLIATIYKLTNQENELELLKLISFEPFDLPKRVEFDHINHLLFILGDDFLEAYKYPKVLRAPLQAIFKIKAEVFNWHQASQRLLLVESKKLYQFSKGKFRLIRVIKDLIPKELTNQGILCVKYGSLYLASYKNLNHQIELVLPSMESEMAELQEKASGKLDDCDGEVDPRIGDLETSCNTIKIALETRDYLLVYANLTSSQDAMQKCVGSWEDYVGKIYSQHLLKYNYREKEYKMIEKKKKTPGY